MDFIDGVRKFNLAAGRTEDQFDPRAVGLHIGLMLEEMGEVLASLDDGGKDFAQICAWFESVGCLFKKGVYDSLVEKADRVALLDGCIDVKVVTVGCVMAQGVDVQGACGEVNRSNLAKLVDGVAIKDANGKIQKPEGWTPPNLAQFVRVE